MSKLSLDTFRATYSPRTLVSVAGNWDIWGGQGDGPLMLFLPGAQGTGEMFFKATLDFADRFNTATVTYPPESDAGVLADGLAEVIANEGHSDVILVGSSFGGYVAQRFAEKYPSILKGLVIGNSFSDAGPVQAERYNPNNLRGMDAETLKATMLGRVKDGPDSELKDVLLDVMADKQPAETLKSRAMGVALSTPVTTVPIPLAQILVIDSDPDPVVGEVLRDTLVSLYQGAAHVRIQGGTHYPYVVAFESYAKAIRDFVDTL